MDAQMKRGFLEACVLATLERRESYGYQIIKDVPASLGLTESSLYPLLKRLQGADMISVRTAEHNGRLRKYYRITAAGRERLAAFLAEQDEIRGLYRYVEESMGLSSAVSDADAPATAGRASARRTTDGAPASASDAGRPAASGGAVASHVPPSSPIASTPGGAAAPA